MLFIYEVVLMARQIPVSACAQMLLSLIHVVSLSLSLLGYTGVYPSGKSRTEPSSAGSCGFTSVSRAEGPPLLIYMWNFS